MGSRRKRDAEAPPQNNGGGGVGGIGGTGYNNRPGGSGGNFLGNNNNNNNGFDGNDILAQLNDPTYRREISITVEFLVEEELKDNEKPWTKLSYVADTKEDTCQVKPEDINCDREKWAVNVRMQDEKSGLLSVGAVRTGASTQNDEIFYKYVV